jgi:hypothetical protein
MDNNNVNETRTVAAGAVLAIGLAAGLAGWVIALCNL